ncbi:MAG TPA: aminoacyl-histidine dipeptidase [Phycisphaerae bacterium]|nr:aminoacyl-histidine dipeptidase [Phycisphaerae bacterium]
MSADRASADLTQLEPKSVWRFFAGLTGVPRPSKNEARIQKHVLDLAESFGFKSKRDASGNIVITVPATPGCESAPITVLQGHLDMVCEKNAGVEQDFDNDPIRTIIAEDDEGLKIVRADGTTLGADNGIGVSLALAAATDPEVVHGPLELLFTSDEEEGMTGAKALAPDSFEGRRLINLDSEEDDALYIGCAGGRDTNLTWRFETSATPADAECLRVSVSGLRGGHSGGDIHEGRASANRLIVRTLLHAADVQVASINGGSKRNAIARESSAVVCGPAGTMKALEEAAKKVATESTAESFEKNIRIEVTKVADGECGAVVSKDDTARLLAALMAVPHGVMGMHPKIPELVQSSNNISTIKSVVDGRAVTVDVGMLTRSSSDSRKEVALSQIVSVGKLSGAKVSHANDYPGWEPNPDSALLRTCSRIYTELFKEEPKVAAIHAGLECGIIGERVGKMDTISFGPRIEGAHSPDEQVWIESVGKIWSYLKAVLAELSKG